MSEVDLEYMTAATQPNLERAIREIYARPCNGQVVQTFVAAGIELEVCAACREELRAAIRKDEQTQ